MLNKLFDEWIKKKTIKNGSPSLSSFPGGKENRWLSAPFPKGLLCLTNNIGL